MCGDRDEVQVIVTPEERDRLLIEKAKRGDRRAFGELVQTHEPRLRQLVEVRLGPRLRASFEVADVVQETLMRALRSLEDFEWRREDAFFSWLAGIVENVIRSAAQRSERRAFLELDRAPPPPHSSQSQKLRREERFDRLSKALEALSPEHREVILLARIERRRIQEIAGVMNRSPEAVKKLLVRALRKLKESFGDTESFHLPPRRLEGGDGHDG